MSDRVELRSLTDASGTFRILAVDHRDSLQALVKEGTDADLIGLKADLVEAAVGFTSGVMLDPSYGMQPDVLRRVPAGAGIIAALEAQGYLADEAVTHTTLVSGWDALQARAAGAHAAKFLALWDGTPNPRQDDTIADARRTSHEAGLPLVLEPLPRGLDPYGSWVIEWARVHRSSGADVFKLPYPGSEASCLEVSAILEAPWVMLSAGADFDTFLGRLETAAATGASGYIVGRAVWREAATLDRTARSKAISNRVVPRLRRLSEVAFPALRASP